MNSLDGMTRDNCATGCSAAGCVILGDRQLRCCHPLKGGLSLERLQDPAAVTAFNDACAAIGVANAYTGEKA